MLLRAREHDLRSFAFQELEEAVSGRGLATRFCLVVAWLALSGWSLAGNRSVRIVMHGFWHGVVIESASAGSEERTILESLPNYIAVRAGLARSRQRVLRLVTQPRKRRPRSRSATHPLGKQGAL